MQPLFYLSVAAIGLAIGSFVNASVYRLANKQDIVKDRSKCTKCLAVLKWNDLIPIYSYLSLRGKCRYCSKPFSLQYLLVELGCGILFLITSILWLQAGSGVLVLVRDLLSIAVLLFLFVFDLRYYLLPDIVTLPSIGVFFGINLYLGYSVQHLLLAIIVGGGFFALQFLISKGKWIGGGDIRFGALMGALLSWPGVLVALFLSYIIGSFISIGLVLFGKKGFGSKVPFGTFLAIGTVITLWWGRPILNWYLGML